MTVDRYTIRGSREAVLACALAALLNACTVAGPNAIQNGRMAYNVAITDTNNQQILMAVLHNRYDEASNLLTVASVTANVRVTTRADVELGIGNDDNYAGNLVPFSATAMYEENPTISYVPVAGSSYMRQFMSPAPVSALAQLSATQSNPAPFYRALISSVNGIRNPDFLFPGVEADPRFERFVALMVELMRAQRLHWIADSERAGAFSIAIDRDRATDPRADELLVLLGLPEAAEGSATIRLPVSLALHGRETGGIGITTRSVYQLAELLAAAVEVPDSDRADGSAVDYPSSGPVGSRLRVRRAESRPDRAVVAVPYRDAWFYIDDTDPVTKRFFRILTGLWSAAIADTTATSAPVLTVPVSR